jgi:signal transduction histidine kinase
MPITFLIGLARVATKRARIGELVVQLGELPSPDRLRDSLARALGDDSLQVGLWVAEEDGYVTPSGNLLDISTPDGTRTATLLERHGQPLAVLLHDPALLDDPGLVAAVTAAARLAVENERLQEEVMQQLAEVHASRARLVEAADAERRRIERNLHDGAQQRLVSLCLALRLSERQLEQGQGEELRRSLAEAATELEEALAELRELARGTFPAILTQFGLAAALGAVAGRSQAPVDVDVQSIEGLRFSERVEAAGYFIVAEALTNVTRYSGATHARLHVGFDGVELHIQVTDNGRGGADPQRGGGLRGLADRVHALEGSLSLQSPEGSGTTITVRLPADPRMADV